MKILLPLAATLLPFGLAAQSTCLDAVPVGVGITATGPVTGEACDYCNGTNEGTDAIWYTYTATADTMMRLVTAVPGYTNTDTRVSVYTGICGALTCVTADDDSGDGNTCLVTWNAMAGTTYTIAFDNRYSSVAFAFEISMLYIPPPPPELLSFTTITIPGAGGIMGAVDMNNDGLDDAVMPGASSFRIAYQQPDASYLTTTFPTTNADNTASWSFSIGDWDSNGHRDLLYGGGSGATFMKANADGTAYTEITFPQYIFCQRTNFVDLNNDGHLDAFSCHDVDANVGFINDGNGNLTFTQGGYGTTCGNYGSIFTDYTNDGVPDLFVAKCGCDPQDLMMQNNGTGAFTNVAPAQGLNDSHQSWSSAWGDFDNDGDMDVLIGASSSGYHKLMMNDGTGNFTNATPGSGMDTFSGQSIEWTAHDFDNNGWIDILGGGALHFNNGDGTFSHQTGAPANQAVGDMNNDGFLDICTSAGYSQNLGNDNNWIRIIPVGVQSNRDAIGARVTITSALGTQIRDIRSGDGFRYMSYIAAHFGLGTDIEVESVSIHWPNGTVEEIKSPAINSTHTVVEGISTTITEDAEAPFTFGPNPVSEVLFISGVPNTRVEVLNAAGQVVMAQRMLGNELDVQSLAPGAYQLRLLGSAGMQSARFIKR